MTVLTCLEILENEPERVDRLHEVAMRMRQAYRDIGLRIGNAASPIIPIIIGSDEKAFQFSQALFENGVFALPAVYRPCPRGQALIRTAFMCTHQDRQLDFVCRCSKVLAHGIPHPLECDLDEDRRYNGQGDSEAGRAKLSYYCKPLQLRFIGTSVPAIVTQPWRSYHVHWQT